MANNHNLLFEYTFVVFVDKISLQIEKPTERNIKFQCDDLFFIKTHLEYLELQAKGCHQSKEIPGQDMYIMSRMKESEVKKHLGEKYLDVNLFDKDASFGTASLDLSPFFKNQVIEMPFGQKHEDQVKISDKDGTNIGSIDYTVILTKEECFTCKSCKVYFKVSTIWKHFGAPENDCKRDYIEKELEEFYKKSKTRRNQKKAQRKMITYDPVKISKQNKRNYNASKRAIRYKREKEDLKRFKPDEEKARKSLRKYKQKRTFLLSTRQKNIFLSALKE